jgi:uncharacterized protein DUF1707
MVVDGERGSRSTMFCHGFHQWDRYDERDERVDEPVDEPVPVGARNPDLRVSQAERDEVAATLARHYADGRLSVAEYEERVAAALEARTARDFEPLLADLPAPTPPTPARPAGGAQGARDWRRPLPNIPRIVAVTAVVLLALGSGLWFLWLLWPALALTSRHRHRARYHYYRHHGPYRPRSGYRYDHTATRWL